MMIKEKSACRLRHELKYVINAQDDFLLAARLRKLLKHDPNADSHGIYRVSSLYFDTPYDKAFREKIDGINCREKFRLRYYGNDISYIRLEKKSKRNGMCGKQSIPINKAEVQNILSGNINFLLHEKHPLLLELYSKMQGQLLSPKSIVTYDRESFIYEPGNVRVTLDRNLRFGFFVHEFLNHQLPHAQVSECFTVLEVKYDEFLPEIIRMAVQIPNRHVSSYSKYAVCRKYNY